ncbi:MAG: hypothetical protein CMH57_03575 [Myxococcales bacterium]|nr:hypothetical protein [Myxococcales bacterium]
MPNNSDAQASGASRTTVKRWETLDADTIERLEAHAESRLGSTLAHRFQLDRIIAIGGMATVYEATQSPLMRRVAVKVLHPTEVEAGRMDFFLREANAASNLRHPNIISIVDFGHEEDGTLFLAMEFVPGEDLGELLGRLGHLEMSRLLRISEQVCLALEVAHRAGVVHCDVKPSNVMIEPMPGNPDFVKVVDFGISRVVTEELGDAPEAPEDGPHIMGSFTFMAPEQLLNRPVVPQTDVYSLGVMIYVALTGQLPYASSNDQELIRAILHEPPRDPREVASQEIPDELVDILSRALAKTPGERYGSAAAMRRALMGLSRRPNVREEADELSALEILFPEDELLEEEVEEPHGVTPIDEVDSQWDTYSDVVSLSNPHLTLREPERVAAPHTMELVRIDTDFSQESLSEFKGRAGRPRLVGRQEQLAQLWQAVQRTRRGGLAVWLSGAYGSGRSFFLKRALKLVEHESSAMVMHSNLDAGDRERPYHALYQLLRAALSELHARLEASTPEAPSSSGDELASSTPPRSLDLPKPVTRELDDDDEVYTSAASLPDAGLILPFPTPPPIPVHRARENFHHLDLLSLGMGKLETSILEALIRRWDQEFSGAPWDAEHRPFDNGPLRFPETRRHLLRFAFDAFLRRLSEVVQETSVHDGKRVPIIIAVDGWEHIDGPTHRIIRQVLQEGRNLPMLFILSHNVDTSRLTDEFPEDDPTGTRTSADQPPDWCDLEIRVPQMTRDEITRFISLELGTTPNKEFIDLLEETSDGSPLFIKELLHLLTAAAPQPPSDDPVLRPIFDLPNSLPRLFKLQLDDLSKDGKQLLAICALLGLTFPEHLLRATLPAEFDMDGAMAELLGVRILEGHAEREGYLQFRMPQMRDLVLRRLYPGQAVALHERIADLLGSRKFAMPRGETELLQAVHLVRGGDPIRGIDHLLDTADAALRRWEPELALRRFRQAQLWIAERMAQAQASEGEILVLGSHHTPEDEPVSQLEEDLHLEDLEQRAVRSTTGMLHAARRLLLHPSRQSDAIIPERLPQQFLERITSNNFTGLSTSLLAEAALEVGRYLACQGLPHSARAALQTALVYARDHGSIQLLIEVELQLAKSLQHLGHLGRATDLASDALNHIRDLGPPPPLAQARHEYHVSQPLDLLAKIYTAQQLFPRAEHYLDQARAQAESDGELDRLHEIYLHYGQLYHAQKQPTRTLGALELALEAATSAYNLRAQARILYNLGVTTALSSRRSESRRYLQSAADIASALSWSDFANLIEEQLRRLH